METQRKTAIIIGAGPAGLTAAIYARRGADGDFLSVHDGGERYIGLSEEVKELPGIIYLDEDFRIDEELFVFGGIGTRYPSPSAVRFLPRDLPLRNSSAAGAFV